MLLSVCIVNWNTRDYLRDCLTSLFAYPPPGWGMEVIVVDNASADGSAAMVRDDFPQATLIALETNTGYAAGNNAACAQARGDALLLLNPDVVVHQHSLQGALDFLTAHPDAAAVGARLLGVNGRTQRSLRSFPDPLPVLWEAIGLARLLPSSRLFGAYRMSYFNYNHSGEADQPMGSFLLIARRAWEQIGPMDTHFPIFFNDVDWCWRAKRTHGWKIYYTPDAVVTHHGGGSTRQAGKRMREESHLAFMRFYEKHYRAHLPAIVFHLALRLIDWSRRRSLRS